MGQLSCFQCSPTPVQVDAIPCKSLMLCGKANSKSAGWFSENLIHLLPHLLTDSAMVFRYRIVLSISECPSHCCTVRRSTPAHRHRVAMLNETCESRSRLCRASHVSHMLSDSRENPASDCNQRSGIPVEVLVSLRFPRPSSFDGILRCLRPSLSTLRSVL
jgi:hypothetical protein